MVENPLRIFYSSLVFLFCKQSHKIQRIEQQWGSFPFNDNHETVCEYTKQLRSRNSMHLMTRRCKSWGLFPIFPLHCCTFQHMVSMRTRNQTVVNSICRLAWRCCYGKLFRCKTFIFLFDLYMSCPNCFHVEWHCNLHSKHRPCIMIA